MRTSGWKFRAVLLVGGGAVIAAAWFGGGRLSLRRAKAQALATLSHLADAQDAAIHRVPSEAVRRVEGVAVTGERAACTIGGWRLALPASEYRLSDDPNEPHVLVARRLDVHFAGPWQARPAFHTGAAPSSNEVLRYFDRTSSYRLTCDAFATTLADVRAAETHEQLQKALYLLLLRSALEPVGSSKQWLRIEVAGRRGFLAGAETSRLIHVSLYLDEADLFAGIGIAPLDGATMHDVYRCLAQLEIRKAEQRLNTSLF